MGRPATLKIDILADAKGVGRGVDDADGHLSRLGKSATRVGAVVGAGMAAGAVAVGVFAKSAVDEASHVQQSFGGLEAVFGKNAATVKRWANGAATAVGLSKAQYADLAAVIGAQLTGMHMPLDQATAKTNDLVKMGADLAATFGGSTKDAVEALSSVLKGETDPIERYGISLKQSDINAQLAADGHDKLTGAALKTATAQASLELVTQAASKAHGQFSQQTNTLAEQQQILSARFDNVKATVGAALLPMLTGLLTFVGTRLAPTVERLAGQLGTSLGPTFAAVGHIVRADVLPILTAVAGFIAHQVIPAVANLAGPIFGALGGVLRRVGGALDEHHDQLAAVGRVLQTTAGWVLKLATPIGTVLGAALTTVGFTLGTTIDLLATLVGWLQTAVHWVGQLSGPLSRVGGIIGKLNPFSVGELAGGVADLTGGAPGYALGPGLTTAALGDPSQLQLLAQGSGGRGGITLVVDARSSVRVDGALDPVSVARQLDDVLTAHRVRLGQVAAWGAA